MRGVVSSSGSLTASTSYDAWGNPETTGGLTTYTPFGFAGGYTDPTGLLYLINRYYDPATGQFVSVDPMVDQTGQPYAYTGDDPVNDVDPLGLSFMGNNENCNMAGSAPSGGYRLLCILMGKSFARANLRLFEGLGELLGGTAIASTGTEIGS